MKKFEFKKENLLKVDINKVHPNSWNPKEPNTKEYENVKKSLEINGYAQPILVREDGDGFEIIDGQHRFLAAKELGYSEIYIYNAGQISDEDAKSMTIWMQTQVPFDEVQLAPIVVELNKLDITLPYTDEEIVTFEKMTQFDFDTAYNEEGPQNDELDDEMKTLNIKMTPEQFETIQNAIKTVMEGENVNEGESLRRIVLEGMKNYDILSGFDDYES